MFLWILILIVIVKRFSYFLLIKNLFSKKDHIFRNITRNKAGQNIFTVISFSSRVGALQEISVFNTCCRCLLFVPLATNGNRALPILRYLNFSANSNLPFQIWRRYIVFLDTKLNLSFFG